MALANRNLVHPDDLRGRFSGPTELLFHVLLVHLLYPMPIQMKLLGNVRNRGRPTSSPDIPGESFGIEGVIRKKGKPLLFHEAAALAKDTANLHVQIDAKPTTGKVSYPSSLSVVKTFMYPTTGATCRFFWRRIKVMTRAKESPKTPLSLEEVRNPGKR